MAWPSTTLFTFALVCCFVNAASHHIDSIATWNCAPPKEWAATEPGTGEARFDLNVTDTKHKHVKLLSGSVHFIGGVKWVNSSTYAVVGTLDVDTTFLDIGAWHSLTTERLADIMAFPENKFGGEQLYLNARERICRGKPMQRDVGVFNVSKFSGTISYITDIPFDKMQALLNITSNPSFCNQSPIHFEKAPEPFKYIVLFTQVYVAQFAVLVLQIRAVDTREKALAIPIFSVALLVGCYWNLMGYYLGLPSVISFTISVCEVASITWLVQLLTARRYPTIPRNAILEGMLMLAAVIVGFFVLGLIDIFLFQVDYLVAVLTFSFFMPQIVKNQTEGQWGAPLPSFIIVTAVATVALPFYVYAHSRPFLAGFITVYVAAQAAYLLWGVIWQSRRTSQYSEIIPDE